MRSNDEFQPAVLAILQPAIDSGTVRVERRGRAWLVWASGERILIAHRNALSVGDARALVGEAVTELAGGLATW